MALLQAEPPEPVRSLGELFAIARKLEHDAASHYDGLAARTRGAPEAAAVFERLAAEARAHAAEVERRSEERTGRGPDPSAALWAPRGMFDRPATGDGVSRRLETAYRALSLAVRHKERAFAFWSYVVAQAGDPSVRQAAAGMAAEELDRASALRRERRLAFHAERRASRGADGGRTAPGGAPGPTRDTASLERELAALLRELAAAAAARGDEDQASDLRRMSVDSERMAEEAAAVRALAAAPGRGVSAASGEAGGGHAPWQAALRLAEQAIERYLAIAEGAKDEAAMLKAQSLAERAVARSARLEAVLG